MKFVLTSISIFYSCVIFSQYSPPAGYVGTTAIHKDSSIFIDWAVSCFLERGYQDIANPSLGLTSVGNEISATGKPFENGVVSLGDGGRITCVFNFPIQNGPGPDFAVFENAFSDSFLELAFVEVSSNGKDFVRFPAYSNTDTSIQIGTFDTLDAQKIHNLAGKYRSGFGTPFDLEDVKDSANINIQYITHVRIVDVIGSLNESIASVDAQGFNINDPYPTPFPSGGFDLDAIGIIHAKTNIYTNTEYEIPIVYPNPAHAGKRLNIASKYLLQEVQIYNPQGNIVYENTGFTESFIDLPNHLQAGIYLLYVKLDHSTLLCQKLIIYPS